MTVHLPKDLESRVEAAVENGQFASIDEAMAEAARLLLRQLEAVVAPPCGKKNSGPSSIGCMRDAADELDEIVVDVYARRNEAWRDIAIE